MLCLWSQHKPNTRVAWYSFVVCTQFHLCTRVFIQILFYTKLYERYMHIHSTFNQHSIEVCVHLWTFTCSPSFYSQAVCVCSKHFRWFWYTIQFVWFVAFALCSKWSPAEWKHVIMVSKRVCNSNIEFSSVWVDSVWLVQYTPHQRCIKLWES